MGGYHPLWQHRGAYRFLFGLCLVVFVIGFGLQIRDYRRKPEQDKTMALVGLTLTAISFALTVAGNLLD